MDGFITSGFDTTTLVNGINAAPVSLGPVSRSGLFGVMPINSTQVVIENDGAALTLVRATPRGAPGDVHPSTKRTQVRLTAPHFLTRSTIMADSLQDVTGFRMTGAPANANAERDRVLREHRARLEATVEYGRCRALSGQILDSDGTTVLVDLLAEFGVAANVQEMALDVSTTSVANLIVAAKRRSAAETGIAIPSGFTIFASPSFMDAIRVHASVAAALVGWSGASALLADHRFGDFEIANVPFVEVGPIAGRDCIAMGKAFMVPTGIPDLFNSYFAPADYMEAVNLGALPFYAKANEMDFNRGVQLESQTNVISLCTRPRAIVEIAA